MVWQSCGVVSLNNWDWKTFNLPVVGTKGVFKIKQTFNQGLIYPSGYFLFSWICSNAGMYGTRRFYFDNQHERLFHGELPNYLLSTCSVRYGLVKLVKSARVDTSNIPKIEFFELFD